MSEVFRMTRWKKVLRNKKVQLSGKSSLLCFCFQSFNHSAFINTKNKLITGLAAVAGVLRGGTFILKQKWTIFNSLPRCLINPCLFRGINDDTSWRLMCLWDSCSGVESVETDECKLRDSFLLSRNGETNLRWGFEGNPACFQTC